MKISVSNFKDRLSANFAHRYFVPSMLQRLFVLAPNAFLNHLLS